MKKQPVFLTDRDRLVVLEAIAGMPNAAVPDSLKPFEVLEPNTSEGASEKHLPIIETDGNHVTVKVGSIFHPMSEEHNIGWVCLQTKAGVSGRPRHKTQGSHLYREASQTIFRSRDASFLSSIQVISL